MNKNKQVVEEHLTVEVEDEQSFLEFCKDHNIKCVLIELEKGEHRRQLMTSNLITYSEYLSKRSFNKLNLLKSKYNIIREKYEVSPNTFEEYNFNFEYLECHIRAYQTCDNKDLIQKICRIKNWHKAKNLFKKINDNTAQILLTNRSHTNDINEFNYNVGNFQYILNYYKILQDKLEIEVCVYDSKISLDKGWIK